MPAGNSNTGRNTPNTPGSKIDAEDSTGTPMSSRTGDAARTTIFIRPHRTHHESTKAPQPIAHNATNTGTTLVPGFAAVAVADAVRGTSPANGSFTCSTITGTL